MGKRRFLKVLSGMGLSGTTLRYLTQDAAAGLTEDLKQEVPYVKALKNLDEPGERKPIYDTMDRELWVRRESAFDAAQKIKEQLRNRFDTTGISIAAALRTKGTPSDGYEIEVAYRKRRQLVHGRDELTWTTETPAVSKSTLTDALPTTITGEAPSDDSSERVEDMQVKLVEETTVDTAYYDEEYRPVPGGCQIVIGSTGAMAHKQSDVSKTVMLSSGHGVEGSATDGDGKIEQPTGGAVMGYPGDYENDHSGSENVDFGEIEPKSGVDLTDRFAEDGGGYTTTHISGIVTWDYITGDGSGELVNKRGASTGHTTGYFTKFDNSTNDKVYHTDVECYNGDSGAPHYVFVDGSLYIVGILSNGIDTDSDGAKPYEGSLGNNAERIEGGLSVWIY